MCQNRNIYRYPARTSRANIGDRVGGSAASTGDEVGTGRMTGQSARE